MTDSFSQISYLPKISSVKNWVLLFLLCSLPIASKGFQQLETSGAFIITNFDKDDGLSTETVTDITMGEDGYLYISSNNGLIRMDGIHTDVFTVQNVPGLRTDRISRVYSLPSSIFISDQLGFLYRFKEEIAVPVLNPNSGQQINTQIIKKVFDSQYLIVDKDYVYLADEDNIVLLSKSISSFKLWDASMAPDSTVYILNKDGLYAAARYEHFKKIPFPDSYKPDLNHFSRIENFENHLRVTSGPTSAAFNLITQQWDLKRIFTLPDLKGEIMHIKQLPGNDQTFLIASTEGLYTENNESVRVRNQKFKALRYESWFQDADNQILVAQNGVWINGVEVFKPKVRIDDAAIDKNGGIWITTVLDGVYNIKRNPFTNYTDQRVVNSYSVIQDNAGSYWAASFENGITRWSSNKVDTFNQANGSLPTDVARMLITLRDGSVLASLWGEPPFIVRDDSVQQLTSFWPLFSTSTNVTEGFYEDQNGRWWLGTLDRLYIKEEDRYIPFYDGNQKSLTNISKIVASPYNDDMYFCTTNNGLILLRNNSFHYLSENLSPAGQHVRDVFVSSPDTLWVATYNDGLHRYILDDEEISVQVLNTDSGLVEAGYHRFLTDTLGYFWLSSNQGLLRVSRDGLNKSADKGKILTNLTWFGQKDGLVNIEFNGGTQSTGFIDQKNDFWFTNMSGLISFNPYSIPSNTISPSNFRIQKVSTTKQSYLPGKKTSIQFDSNERTATIKFAHLSLNANQTDMIWYRMGGGKEWQKPKEAGYIYVQNLEPGDNTITFTQDPDSDIIFATFTMIVKPYFYETASFRLIGFLLIGATMYLFFRYSSASTDIFYKISEEKPTADTDNPEAALEDENEDQNTIKAIIDHNFTDPELSISKLGTLVNKSHSTIYRIWQKNNTQSINKYILEKRLEYSIHLLKEEGCNITEAALKSGFASQSYYSKVFKKEYGTSPTNYLKLE